MHALNRERQQDAETVALNASADMLTGDLLAALRRGDMDAPALFAPMVRDWRAPMTTSKPLDKRHQTVGEVVLGQMSGTRAFDQLTTLICQLAYTAESHANLAAKARELLKSIAADFGDNNATGETE